MVISLCVSLIPFGKADSCKYDTWGGGQGPLCPELIKVTTKVSIRNVRMYVHIYPYVCLCVYGRIHVYM